MEMLSQKQQRMGVGAGDTTQGWCLPSVPKPCGIDRDGHVCLSVLINFNGPLLSSTPSNSRVMCSFCVNKRLLSQTARSRYRRSWMAAASAEPQHRGGLLSSTQRPDMAEEHRDSLDRQRPENGSQTRTRRMVRSFDQSYLLCHQVVGCSACPSCLAQPLPNQGNRKANTRSGVPRRPTPARGGLPGPRLLFCRPA